jgi:N-acetylglucosamine-6-phosphate deacetylase
MAPSQRRIWSVAPLTVLGERVVTPSRVIEKGALFIENGRITAVDAAHMVLAGDVAAASPKVLRAEVVMPGFIDMHVHGFDGLGLGGGTEAVRDASRRVARTGVTTWYAGLGHGSDLDEIVATVEGAARVVKAETGGAKLAGIFMEGPYISQEKRGAWSIPNLRPPSVEEQRHLVEASAGTIVRFNVAPELPGALEFSRAASDQGIRVSLGHSNASYEEAVAGIDSGATVANHTFNAMSGLDHRKPGLVGATLTREELLAELILDGVHVHPAAALALFLAKGASDVALITDGSQLTGMLDGVYERGGRTLIVEGGACRLPDGTLAGSVSPFDRDVRNAAAWLTADLRDLAALSSGNAARAMGIDRETGSIRAGLRADLVLLDNELHVTATIAGGEVVFARKEISDRSGPA